MKLRVYQRVQNVHTLGPGVRYGLWVQGCLKRCKGCVSPEAQPLYAGRLIDVKELTDEIINTPQIEGITVSGGEPLLQPEALCELLSSIKKQRDLGVLIYTGLYYEEIVKQPFLQWCDVLIDGEYEAGLDDGKSLRGSANQRVFYLTERYKGKLNDGLDRRNTEFSITQEHRLVLVGVPTADDIEMSKDIRKFFHEGKKDGL